MKQREAASPPPDALELVANEECKRVLYKAQYEYVYDPDPILLEFMKDNERRKKIDTLGKTKGEENLTLEEEKEYEILKRYNKNRYTKKWFTMVLSALRILALHKEFAGLKRRRADAYFFAQSIDIGYEIKDYLASQEPVPQPLRDRVDRLLSQALKGLFPDRSQEEIADDLQMNKSKTG